MAQIKLGKLEDNVKPRIQFLEWRDNILLLDILRHLGYSCSLIPLKAVRGILPLPTLSYINQIKSDVVITHNPYHGLIGAAIAKKLGKTNTIGLRLKGNYWEESADKEIDYAHRAGFALKLLQNSIGLEETDFIVACSDYLKEVTEKKITDKPCYMMYEGVDTMRFRPRPPKPEYSSEILCVMNFKVRGKLLYLKSFFDYYKDLQMPYTITFLGDGPYRKYIEKQAVHAGLEGQITFKGYVGDIEHYYTSCKLLVHPSSLETLGMVVQEAASSKVPAVTTRIGGLPEVVYEGITGYTTNDMGLFVEKIEQLMSDEEKRAWMGINARNLMIKKFSWKRCAEQFVSILEKEYISN